MSKTDPPALVGLSEGLGHTPRQPTLNECHSAGVGPTYVPTRGYNEGGLPNDADERARFEAYMRGHCWDVGKFDAATNSYDTMHVRCLYGVWRDRGVAVAEAALAKLFLAIQALAISRNQADSSCSKNLPFVAALAFFL